MPYKQTLEEGLKEFEKFIFAVKYKQGETEIVDFDYHAKEREMLKSFLTTFAEKIRESVVGEVRDEIKKVYQNAKEDHICRFNDGEQNCECYYNALNDLLAQLKD